MNGYQYVFVGHVLPAAANVTFPLREFNIDTGSVDGCISGTMDVTHSDITIKLQRTEPIRDLAMVKDRLQRMALITTAAYGFSYGLGLDVEITKEIGQSSPPFVFVKSCTEIASCGNSDEVSLYWNLTDEFSPSSRVLRLALINYMRALRDPEEAIMFCFRAIDAIRHEPTFAPPKDGKKDKEKAEMWTNLRTALNCDESYFSDLTDLAKHHRHGEQVIPSHQMYAAGVKTVHNVIQRYAEYLNRGKVPLSLDDFPQLTMSEFPSDESDTNTTASSSVSSTSVTNVTVSNAFLDKRTD